MLARRKRIRHVSDTVNQQLQTITYIPANPGSKLLGYHGNTQNVSAVTDLARRDTSVHHGVDVNNVK